jgi:SAM-dependent methyltransferase
MTVEAYVDGVRRLSVQPALADTIEDLVGALGRRADWRRFGAVPGEAVETGALGRLRAALVEPFASYRFLLPSPFQALHLRRLARTAGPDSRRLFEFLCLGRPVAAPDLEAWIGPDRLGELREQGLVVALGGELALALACVPAGDHFYVADTHAVLRHGKGLGLAPAHLSEQTRDFIVWLRAALARARVGRLLEVGSGIGMVLLELRDLAPERVGAEIEPRAHALARVNQALRRDGGVDFVQSDLFADVAGTFDAIVTNPWQPSFEFLDLLRRFLSAAPARLRPGGWIALWASTHTTGEGGDPVLDLVREFAGQERFHVTRHVIRSWFAGDRRVDTISCFVLARGRSRSGWRVAPSARAVQWQARRLLSRLRRG